MRNKILIIHFIMLPAILLAQKSEKLPRYFENPIIADSASSVMIPVSYNEEMLSANKLALWNRYYANIIFYNVQADSARRLFPYYTFIRGFNQVYSPHDRILRQELDSSSKWLFYFVKPADYNRSGRINDSDPVVLYVSDKYGENLQAITPANENVLTLEIFNKQGFALIKMQRDQNSDRNFDSRDKDFYYMKLDLNTLKLGKRIEVSDR